LGILAKSQLPGALGDAIFSMDLNQISNIVRTDFGFHIIKLYDIQSDGKIQFDLVKNELEQELLEQRSNESFLDNERELADALFDAGNIEELARDLQFSVQTQVDFTTQGGGSFGSNQLVIDALFDAQRSGDQDISDIIEVDSNRSIVFQIEKYNESQIKPLSEVRDKIISDMKIVSAEILANDIATRLEDQFLNNGNIEEAVNGLDSVTLRNVFMNRASEDEDFMLQASVFGEKRPQEGQFRVGTVIMSNSNYAVYSVDESIYGIPETIPQEERDEARNQLNQQSGITDYTALISELAMRAKISRNEEIISSSSLFD
jgi:peptidyl-prolyl cis-trans isomerase D